MSDAYDEGAKFLARRMRTTRETRQHLEQKGYEGSDIQEAMDFLTENRALDDGEYAAVYARRSFEKGKSAARIRAELKARGISGSDAEAGLARLFPDDGSRTETEGERARAIAETFLAGAGTPPDSKALAKTGRKLAGLGYDSELIYRILGEYMQRGKP